MVDCRRDSLWQKLLQVTETCQIIRITCLEALPKFRCHLSMFFQETDPGLVSPHVSLSHVEFLELISLVSVDVPIMMITLDIFPGPGPSRDSGQV